MSDHNAGLAAVFSFLFSGLGQIYNGQIKKGLVIVFFSSVLILFVIVGAILVRHWLLYPSSDIREIAVGAIIMIFSILSIGVLSVYSIFDAHSFGKKE